MADSPGEALLEIDGGPCGQSHTVSPGALAAYERVTAGRPLAIVLETPDGRWRVPRLYLACHGVKASEVPVLARRYRWEAGNRGGPPAGGAAPSGPQRDHHAS